MGIGNRIQIARERLGWNRPELARKCGGWSAQRLEHYEKGREPKKEDLLTIAKNLGVRPEWLYFGFEPMEDDGADNSDQLKKNSLTPEAHHALRVAIYTANVLRETGFEMEMDRQIELAKLLFLHLLEDAREHAAPEADVIDFREVRRMIKYRLAAS